MKPTIRTISGLVIATIMAATAYGGFSRNPPNYSASDCGPYPKNYEELTREYLGRTLRDPDSAKIRFVERPTVGAAIVNHQWTPAWQAQVAVNAKNGFGGYTGEHMFLISYYQGRVIDAIDASMLGR